MELGIRARNRHTATIFDPKLCGREDERNEQLVSYTTRQTNM
jgi:hypothetical protein